VSPATNGAIGTMSGAPATSAARQRPARGRGRVIGSKGFHLDLRQHPVAPPRPDDEFRPLEADAGL
jgi:hypothetical protein